MTAGLKRKAVKPSEQKRVTIDTTVQEKGISFPTDSKLLNRSRERSVKPAKREGIRLRQSFSRKGPEALLRTNPHGHARQTRCMRGQLRKLRTYLDRVVSDIERENSWTRLVTRLGRNLAKRSAYSVSRNGTRVS